MKNKIFLSKNKLFIVMLAVLFALCITLGIVLVTPAQDSRALENVLKLDKLEDFNVVDNGDGTYAIPKAKVYYAVNIDDMSIITPEDALKSEPVALFDGEGSLDDKLRDYAGIFYLFNNGLSVSTLKKLLGKEESDPATADEMMCSVFDGTASFVYDGIEITIPKEITSVGDGAFLVSIALMDKLFLPFGFSQATPMLIQMLNELLPELPAIPISETLPALTGTFSAEIEGRTETVTSGSAVIGISDCSLVDFNGFKEIGDNFLFDSSELFGAENGVKIDLGTTLEKICGVICTNMYSVGEITLPSSLKYVGDYAFCRIGAIITIPEDSQLEYIGDGAFEVCGFTEDLTLPSTVRYLGERAFDSNDGLTSVVLPEGLESIKYSAFGSCSKLKSITLPSTLKSMHYYSFDFWRMEEINVPDLATWVGIEISSASSSAFHPLDLSKISIKIDGTRVEGDIVIPEGVTSISGGAFHKYKGLTSVTIPSSVVNIGDRAFYGCSEISSVKFVDKVVGGKVVGVESNLATIGKEAFYGLNKMTEFVIPKTVTSIANGTAVWTGARPDAEADDTGAFDGCDKLLVIYNLSDLDVQLGSKENGYVARSAIAVYDSYNGISPFYTDANGFVFTEAQDGVYLIGYTGDGGEITLPASYSVGARGDGRYAIAIRAFDGNSTITGVTIPSNSVTNIGDSAFVNCEKIKTVYIGAGVDGIGDSAFAGCTSLKSVTIVSGLETLGSGAFMDCSALTEISLQNSNLTSIGDCAFKNCSSLLAIVIPDTVITVGKEAFYGCSNATDISIGNSVEYIGEYAFAYTSSLTDAVIPDSVTTLGTDQNPGSVNGHDGLFDHSGIRSVYIGAGIKTLNSTFAYCSNLTEVTFAENSVVQSLVEAFRSCDSIKKLVLPESVINIDGLFYGNTSTPNELRLSPNVDFLTRYTNSTVYYNSLFTLSVKAEHFTVYLPEVTESNRETYGKNFALLMLIISYPDTYNSSHTSMYTNTVFVAPGLEAYKLILNEIYDFYYKTATSTRVAYYTEWYTTAFTKIRGHKNYIEYMSYNRPTRTLAPQDRLFYLADVTYEVRDASGNLLPNAAYTEQKLARTVPIDNFSDYITNGSDLYDVNIRNKYIGTNEWATFRFMQGADLRYVLIKDELTDSQYYVIDENYTLPEKIGVYAASGNWTLDGKDVTDVSKQLVNGALTYVNTLQAEGSIIVDLPKRFTTDYTGNAWTVPTGYEGIFEVTAVDGNADKVPTSAGTYTLTLSLKDGYQFADGSTTTTVELVIKPVETSVVWTWKGEDLADGVIPEKYYDGKTISSELEMWFVGADGSKVIVPNESLQRYKNGELTNEGALGAGRWTLAINRVYIEKNYLGYVLSNTTKDFVIKNITLGINDLLDNLTIDLAGSSSLSRGLLYIYQNGSEVIPSYTQLDRYTLIEVVNVQQSIARFVNGTHTIAATVSDEAAERFAVTNTIGAERSKIGRQVTVFTVSAMDNYVFALNGNAENASVLGLAVNVSDDGKTVTITKTWYVVQLANELLKADAASENDVYSIDGWTYGQDVIVMLPRLMHGDEAATWASDDAHVKFTLYMSGVSNAIVSEENRSELLKYINKYMPAGHYTLIVTVAAFDEAAHDNWFNEGHSEAASYPTFARRYEFDVAKASITINANKLIKDDATGYANYNWELTDNANKELFFKDFADAINADGVLNTVTMTAPEDTYWGTPVGKTYFGNYNVKYNFARMNNEVYVASNNNDILTLVNGGAKGTYTVYFQIEMLNHENLTNIGCDGRYAYFFTVTVYETIETPTVIDDGLVYTGNKVLPEIAESNLYEVIWNANDTYIAGGSHSVSFKLYDNVHYRWKNATTDTVSVNFTIAKADNVFTVALNMLGWNYETFDAAINNIRATTKFLDNGQEIHFRVVKKGETAAVAGLTDFTIDANGKVNAAVAQALNSLKVGEYTLYAKVNETSNYNELERNVSFAVAKSANAWADGEDDLVLPSWIVGTFNPEENLIVVKAAHGEAIIEIRDMDGNVYYNSTKPEENTLNSLDVGKYLLVAWVAESEDFAALAERSFTIEVLEKLGMPWWGTMLVVVGALAVAAVIILILWKLKVFEILTDKISLAITTRATVDATIAAVRATKKAEEADAHKRKVEARERLEVAREANRNKTPEQRAEELAAKAEVTATKADKMHAKANKMRERADKLAGKTEQEVQREDITEQQDDTSTEE